MPNFDLNTLFGTMPRGQLAESPFLPILQSALSDVEGMQPPVPEEVPQALHPLGAFASTFASSLAEAMGQRGAGAQNQARLMQQEEARTGAIQRNQQQQAAFVRQKQLQRLDLQLKIGEAKQEMFMQQQNAMEAEKQAARNFTIQARLEKIKQEGEKERQTAILDRQIAGIEKRGEVALKNWEAKRTVMEKEGANNPAIRFVLKKASDKADSLQAQVAKMHAANSEASRSYQPLPFSQAVIDAAEAKLQSDLNDLYDRAWDEYTDLAGKTPAAGAPTTKRPKASDF